MEKKDTTQKSTYLQKIVSEINDSEEMPEATFPINLKLIEKYQQTEPILMANYEDGMYHTGSFSGESNVYINLITCEDNIVSP